MPAARTGLRRLLSASGPRGAGELPAMHLRLLRFSSACLCVAAVNLLVANPANAQAPRRSNPTSKLYVAELAGASSIDDGKSIQPLKKDGMLDAEGAAIETTPEASLSLVLSNGTAMHVGPETRIEFKRFLQEPFAPNRNDLDIEPSRSQLNVQLARGSVGLCTAKPAAGSSMVYQTPQATLTLNGRRLYIETNDSETRVALLEGDVTVIGDPAKGGAVLLAGQQAIIHQGTPGAPATVAVTTIPDEESARLDEAISLACISRRTVYFESVPRNGDGTTATTELVPVRTTPGQAPTQFTVSPSRLTE